MCDRWAWSSGTCWRCARPLSTSPSAAGHRRCAPWLLALWVALLTGPPTLLELPHLRPSAL